MRKTVLLLAMLVSAATPLPVLHAGSLAGVNLPDTSSVEGKVLALNGLGLRTKFMVKVYVVGLYLEQKSSDPNAILQNDAPRQIVMKFLHSASKSQLADGFSESFDDNAPDAKKTLGAEIGRFLGALEAVKEGDQIVFTYLPVKGTTFALNGTDQLTVPGPAFGSLLFSVWLGPKPPSADLKKGLLGR